MLFNHRLNRRDVDLIEIHDHAASMSGASWIERALTNTLVKPRSPLQQQLPRPPESSGLLKPSSRPQIKVGAAEREEYAQKRGQLQWFVGKHYVREEHSENGNGGLQNSGQAGRNV